MPLAETHVTCGYTVGDNKHHQTEHPPLTRMIPRTLINRLTRDSTKWTIIMEAMYLIYACLNKAGGRKYHCLGYPVETWEWVASATRHKMNENRPHKIVHTTRAVEVLLPRSVSPRLGSRSAWVTAVPPGIIAGKPYGQLIIATVTSCGKTEEEETIREWRRKKMQGHSSSSLFLEVIGCGRRGFEGIGELLVAKVA